MAPTYRMQLADATNENGVVMTSCPGPTPAAIIAQCSPAVPDETPIACRRPASFAQCALELARPCGPIDSVARVQHVDDGVDLALGDVGLGEGDGVALQPKWLALRGWIASVVHAGLRRGLRSVAAPRRISIARLSAIAQTVYSARFDVR